MLSFGRMHRRLFPSLIILMIAAAPLLAQDTESNAAAESPHKAQTLESRRMGSSGNWAQGFYGDYFLGNKHLKATISNIAQENNLFPSGGFLLDISNAAQPLDYFSYFNTVVETPSLRKIKYTKAEFVETGYARNAKAIVLTGHLDRQEKMPVKTEYILEPNAQFIRIITTLKNDTGETYESFNVYDEVNWGALIVFIPSQGFISTINNAQSDWVGGLLDDESVILGSPKPNAPLNISHNLTTSKVYYQTQPAPLPNGQEKQIERVLFMGDGNTAQAAGELYRMKRIPLGIISGTMLEDSTNQPIPNTEIRILQSRDEKGQHVPVRPFTKALTDERGRFSVRLPQGSYFVLPNPIGRTRENRTLSVDVLPNRTTVLELKASKPIYLNYSVVDADTKQPIASKLSFVIINPTPPVNFGPPFDASGARNTVYSHNGQGRIMIEPGYYGVFVSRGIEYSLAKREIEVTPTGENQLRVELKREMPVTGYVSLDIGSRTNQSWDTHVTPRDRVISAAAEGVDILVTGDANTATNLKPVIEELNLQNQINAITGMRLEYDKKDVPGNFLLFPVPDTATAKAPALLQASGGDELFKAVAQTFPPAEGTPQTMLAVMRPLMPFEGYFNQAGWDNETGKLNNSANVPLGFDFLDIWEGKRQGVLEMNNNLFVWLSYNNRFPGIIGGSNSHTLFGEETGYPRVFVQSSTDNPAQMNVNELLSNLKAGKVVITNGPWIDFKINGKGLGEIASDTDGDSIIECELIVRAPSWVQTDFIDILGDGMFRKRIIRRSYNTTQHYPPADKMDETKFRMRMHRDMIVQVKVVGERGMEPVVTRYGAGDDEYVRPYAITGPIYLDLDGDGVCKLPDDYAKRAD